MNKPEIPPPRQDTQEKAVSPSHCIQFNVEEWLPYFDDTDLTYEQKCEAIRTLWNMITVFVELGFGLNSHQRACGEDFNIAALLQIAMLDLEDTDNDNNNEEDKR